MNTLHPTRWDTVANKEKFIAKFKGFVKSGFKESHFTKEFYKRMSMMRGHIAHYDRGGFYNAQFSNTQRQMAFLYHWTTAPVYGDPTWTWSDVEDILKTWLEDNPEYINILRARLQSAREQTERAELARLSAKYPTPKDAVQDQYTEGGQQP
jgi:hypothetical protein